MATFAELHTLYARGTIATETLFGRVVAGVFVVADLVRAESPGTAPRRAWASRAFRNPRATAEEMWPKLMASAKAMPVADIQNPAVVTDQVIQDAILSAVDVFAGEV